MKTTMLIASILFLAGFLFAETPYIGYSDYKIITDTDFDTKPYFETMHSYGVNLQRIDLAREEEVTVVVQVNGKLRGSVVVPRGAEKEHVYRLISGEEKVQKFIENKAIAKIIFVPDKLMNIVVKEK